MNSLDLIGIAIAVGSLIGARYLYLHLRHERWRTQRLRKRIAQLEKRNDELLDDLDLAIAFRDAVTSHPSARQPQRLALIQGGAS